MFDHVYVLAEGQCVYQGSSLNTVEYLTANGLECPKYHNPADYSKPIVINICENFLKNDFWFLFKCLRWPTESMETLRINYPNQL
jgi:hypothetical protein